jgi:ketosteroid isomerase-like protein
MQESQNTKVVQDAYAAFGRGDVTAILDLLDDAVVWRPIAGAGKHVPTAGERRGKAAVGEFFRSLGEGTVFETFEPKEFFAQGQKVVALGHYTGLVKPTGRRYASDWAMVFTLRNGKVVDFHELCDSAAINAAWTA